jgi:probable F420-dependent oxidoreductase
VQFTVQYPLAQSGYDPALRDPATLIRFVQAAEAAGFGAVGFTEHPAPSRKWMAAGGHESFDPLAALAFCAAATTRIRLLTYLLILPYRNPLQAAKTIATVDVLSGGRLILGVGGGYMRSEFAALGAEFDERNEAFDEAVTAMRGIWNTDGFAYQGRHFTALAQTALPRPVQRPHPPFWIGGNSRAARDRVARYGQGWAPLLIGDELARTIRTPPLPTAAALKAGVDEIRDRAARAGRDAGEIAALEVQVESPHSRDLADGRPLGAHREVVAELAASGATWFVVDPPGDDAGRACDALTQYGEQVIAQLG